MRIVKHHPGLSGYRSITRSQKASIAVDLLRRANFSEVNLPVRK